jgi:hypothetical protein
MAAKDDDKSLGRLKSQVDKTIEISDILAGKKDVGGKLGVKVKKQREKEADLNLGKAARLAKFKAFDEWLTRMEKINNLTSETKVKLQRAVFVDKDDLKNPNKTL